MGPINEHNADSQLSIDNFEVLKYLGKGSFGTVFMVRKIDGSDKDRIYALKVLRKHQIIVRKKTMHRIIEERNILMSVRHPFIVEMVYSFQCKDHFYLGLEYLSGDLKQLLNERNFFTEDQTRFYAAEIFVAVEFLHSKGIVHRDLKPDNILLDHEGHIKLADFGLSTYLNSGQKTYTKCGTLNYTAPEVLCRIGYGKAVDWWSFGIIVYNMFSGYFPFLYNNENTLEVIKNIRKGAFCGLLQVSYEANSFLRDILTVDVESRLGTADSNEIKTHEFFDGTSWDDVLQRTKNPPFLLTPHNGCSSTSYLDDFKMTRFSIDDSQNDLFKGFTFVNKKALFDDEDEAGAKKFIYSETFTRIIKTLLIKKSPKFIKKLFKIGIENRTNRKTPWEMKTAILTKN